MQTLKHFLQYSSPKEVNVFVKCVNLNNYRLNIMIIFPTHENNDKQNDGVKKQKSFDKEF